MARGFLLTSLFCVSLRAQFDNLVTTDDGGMFLFQSTWRLAGSNDTNLLKIFRWDDKGFSLVFSPPNPGFAEPPYESAPFLSGDGKILACCLCGLHWIRVLQYQAHAGIEWRDHACRDFDCL
jgi:hypothetical protein